MGFQRDVVGFDMERGVWVMIETVHVTDPGHITNAACGLIGCPLSLRVISLKVKVTVSVMYSDARPWSPTARSTQNA